MERLNTHVGSANAPFQQRPKVFEAVSVNTSVYVLNCVIYDLMSIVASKAAIAKHFVSVKRSTSLYVLFDCRLGGFLLAIRESHGAHFSATLQQPKGYGLTLSAGSGDAALARADVHVARLAADERFIGLNFATKHSSRIFVHGFTDAMHHEPSRLLSNANGPRYLAGANSVLAVADHPESAHPLIESKRRILKDSSDLESELFLALGAKPDTSRFDKRVPLGAAARTLDYAVRPTKVERILKAAFGIAEVNNRVLKCLGRVHGPNLRRIALCVKYIITLRGETTT
jgi:hypothetical protein